MSGTPISSPYADEPSDATVVYEEQEEQEEQEPIATTTAAALAVAAPKPRKRAPAEQDKERQALFTSLYSIKRNQIQMLLDRGYTPPDVNVLAEPLDAFVARLAAADAPTSTVTPASLLSGLVAGTKQLYVHYAPLGKTFGAADARELDAPAGTHLLLITYRNISTAARTEIVDSGWKWEHFTYPQLAVDPTRHVFAQKHTLLTQAEAKAFYKTTGLAPTSLPLVYVSDPVVRWYGWRVGQLVRVDRQSVATFTPSSSVFFRLIAPAPLSDYATKVEGEGYP